MRNVLVDFFAAHIVSPGLYVPHHGFETERSLSKHYMTQGATARAIPGRACTGDPIIGGACLRDAERMMILIAGSSVSLCRLGHDGDPPGRALPEVGRP